MEKAERVAELKKNISTLTRVLEEVEGKRGTCSQCGEEGPYANWGAAHDLICRKCWNENERAKARKNYVHLVGLRVEDLIIEADYHPLQGLKLEGGYILEVEREHDGDVYLDVEQKPSKTKLVTFVIPKHHIEDRRWTKEYKEHIGEALLRKCINALRARATGAVIVQLNEFPDEVRKFLKEE